MNISEMHIWFRQYAQQMGAQNTRAILPEQIDIHINTSILDIVHQIVRERIGSTDSNGVVTPKLGQINALLPLYDIVEVNLKDEGIVTNLKLNVDDYVRDYLFLTNFSVKYLDDDEKETLPFDCRIIEAGLLANTLHDFILKPKIISPILVAYDSLLDIYFGDNTRFAINSFSINYVRKPVNVKLGETEDSSVNCDLPEYLHIPILKHAVDLWRAAIQGSNTSSQQQVQQGQVAGGTQQVQ